MASPLSRKLCSLMSTRSTGKPSLFNLPSLSFCTKGLSSTESDSNSDSDTESSPISLAVDSSVSAKQQPNTERPLENGIDTGIYKAILLGQVGQAPIQKKLRNGSKVTLISVGTGGIRNNRRPLDNEDPKEYANRCSVQWHRVSVYPERLGEVAVKNLVPGSILYVEGNLESKVFNDPLTGLIRRIREIAVRRNGRLVFLGNGDGKELPKAEVGGVGYY